MPKPIDFYLVGLPGYLRSAGQNLPQETAAHIMRLARGCKLAGVPREEVNGRLLRAEVETGVSIAPVTHEDWAAL